MPDSTSARQLESRQPLGDAREANGFAPALAAAAAGGILYGIACSHSFTGPLSILAFALLGWALWRSPGRLCAVTVCLWSLLAYAIALRWQFKFGTFPWAVLVLWHVQFLLPLGLVFPWLRRRGVWAAAAGSAGLWMTAEWLVGLGPLADGMAVAAGTLARVLPAVQWASVVGAYGLGYMIVLGGVLLGMAAAVRRWQPLAAGAAVFLLIWGGGWALMNRTIPESGSVIVAAAQGVSEDGFEEVLEPVEALKTYLDLTFTAAEEDGAEVVLWPETSCPGYPLQHDKLLTLLKTSLRRRGVGAIIGTVSREGKRGSETLQNIAIGISSQGEVAGLYYKRRLVPFGEYVPAKDFVPSARRWRQDAMDYSPGEARPPIELAGARFGLIICSESMFSRLALERASEGAGILAIISNDSWFGRGPGTEQLARLSVLRCTEAGRAAARAAETGYSMMIDPKGRILQQTALYDRTRITSTLPICTGATFYSRTFLVWPLLGLLSIGLALVPLRPQPPRVV